MRWPVLLAVATLLLAGCSGADSPGRLDEAGSTVRAGNSPGTTGAGPDLVETGPDDQPRPWSVGDWWRYRFETFLGGIDDFDVTVVVAGETPDAYMLTATEPSVVDTTFFIHLPALGPVRKADFAVTRHAHFVPLLQFPLEHGATWEATIRGEPWTATAARAEVTAGETKLSGWRVEYTDGDQIQYAVEWSAEANWIVREEVYFGLTSPTHTLSLTEWGHNWTGAVDTYYARDLHVKGHVLDTAANALDPAGQEQFTVSDPGDRMLLGVFVGGGDGQCGYGIIPLDATFVDAGLYDLKPCDEERLHWKAIPPQGGSWGTGWLMAAQEAHEFFEVVALDIESVSVG